MSERTVPLPSRVVFGNFLLDRPQHCLRKRSDGTEYKLTPRAYAALSLFVERPGELLDKDTLMRALWPGLVVEDNNISQVVSALRRALGDDGQGSRYIQTVPRVGFRWTAAVQMEAGDAAPAPRAPTLAVLPFVPLLAEGRDELLEAGMADSLIARLSTVKGLVVRSIGSVRGFAGFSQDPLEAARTLDVDWLVDGSLQRRGNRLRVTARLLRTRDGCAAWSGSFDERFTSVFDVQDTIAQRVTDVLAPRLGVVGDAGGSRDADAYQLYLAATQQARGIRADGLRTSVSLYRKALAIDPAYALACTGMAESYRRMLFGADASSSPVVRSCCKHWRWRPNWPKRMRNSAGSCSGSTSTGQARSARFAMHSR